MWLVCGGCNSCWRVCARLVAGVIAPFCAARAAGLSALFLSGAACRVPRVGRWQARASLAMQRLGSVGCAVPLLPDPPGSRQQGLQQGWEHQSSRGQTSWPGLPSLCCRIIIITPCGGGASCGFDLGVLQIAQRAGRSLVLVGAFAAGAAAAAAPRCLRWVELACVCSGSGFQPLPHVLLHVESL